MKKLSKLLAVVLAVAMILAFAVPASAATGPALYAQRSVLSYGQSTTFYMSDGTPIQYLTSDDPDDFVVSGTTVTCMARNNYGSATVGGATITAKTSKGQFTAQVFAGSFPTTSGSQSIQVGGLATFSLAGDTVVYIGSSDHSVAKPLYANSSLLTGVGDGTCTVYLIGRNGTTGSATLRVGTGIGGNTGTGGSGTMVSGNGAYLLSNSISVGGTTNIISTNGTLTAVSLNSNIASVSSSSTSATITGLSAGTATIYYMTSGGGSGTFTVTVGSGTGTGTGATITSQSIQVGGTATILATSGVISYAQSGSPTVASVTTSGGLATVRGLRAGTATITYMTSTGAQGSFTVTVGGSSTTNPDLPNVTPQGTYEMEVGGTKSLAFANTNVARVETSDSSIATGTTYTSSSGKIGARFTGKKAGTCIGYLYTSSGSVSAVNLVVTGDGEVDIDPDDAIGRVGTIQSGDPDLRVVARTSASSSASRKATLSNGVKVTVTGESGSYYQVTFSSSGKSYSGYVKKIYVDF